MIAVVSGTRPNVFAERFSRERWDVCKAPNTPIAKPI
jgi:hypothetical protein